MPARKPASKSQASRKAAPAKPAADRHSADVTAWFKQLAHPLKEEMLAVREIILGADARIEESVKWKTPTFSFKGNLVSFMPNAKKAVSLMFHRGAEIPGKHPRLEGDAALVRTMRFEDQQAIARGKRDLERVVKAWCDLKAGG